VKRLAIMLAMLCLGGVSPGYAETSAPPASSDNGHGPLNKMPTDLEIRYALSALPPSLRANASVYVLDPAKGYVRERNGNNGQSCFIGRTEWKFADYRNDVYDPTCYDAVGAKNHMQVLFDVAALRAQGVDPESVKKKIEEGFKNGKYKAPTQPGFSYMTAPVHRTYMTLDPNDKDTVMTMSMPHIMYYAPHATDAAVGGIPCPPCAPHPFVFEPGPHGYLIQRLGEKETAKIVADEADLVRELCASRRELCLPGQKSSSLVKTP
jgi:hypothetical protein